VHILDAAYRELLARVTLNESHRANLVGHRGMSDEMIRRHGFRSLPPADAWDLRRKLAQDVAQVIGRRHITGVPGFIAPNGRGLTLGGVSGIAIPTFDLSGRVIAIRVRKDVVREGEGRYAWLSSSRHGGPIAQVSAFWSTPTRLKSGEPVRAELVRLTEGEMKAVISSQFTGAFSLSVPGVTFWRYALPMLQALGAKHVLLAFDMDRSTKPQVARAFLDCHEGLTQAGLTVEVETWPAEFKGVDDFLAAQARSEAP
jgi:hypothetical protein